MNFFKRLLLAATSGVLILALDYMTKCYALMWYGTERVVNLFFSLHVSINYGSSWSLFVPAAPIHTYILLAVIAICIAFLIYLLYRRLCDGHTPVFESLVLAGALANMYDRLVYGGVIDFIVLHYKDYYWPSFNIADIAIVSGLCGMCLMSWLYE